MGKDTKYPDNLCTVCYSYSPLGANFCAFCGREFEIICPECGQIEPAKFVHAKKCRKEMLLEHEKIRDAELRWFGIRCDSWYGCIVFAFLLLMIAGHTIFSLHAYFIVALVLLLGMGITMFLRQRLAERVSLRLRLDEERLLHPAKFKKQ